MNHPVLDVEISTTAGFAGMDSEPLGKARDAFAALGETLNDALAPLREAMAANAPDELEVSLELSFKGEAKWVVVSAGGSATATVKLTWKKS